MSHEGLEKIRIELPNHWASGGESMWTQPLGNDLFRVENVPFYAYGLNYHDVVRATSQSEELKPEIWELVQESGHRTFRVFFAEHIDRDKQIVVLHSMNDPMISYERASDRYIALDMEPEGNYQAVYDRLKELEGQEVLEFETCEGRVAGSFDDAPGPSGMTLENQL